MNRIYHPYYKWEEVKFGMYDKFDTKLKDELIKEVIKYFKDDSLVEEYMNYVIENFKYSCEHNLTNTSLNRIAWLGQTSVVVYKKIPFEITMIAWNYLDEITQNKANKIAEKCIKRWEQCQKNI